MRLIVLVLALCLLGCSMLKKTSKTEGMQQVEFEKVIDSRSLVLKTAVRETNTFTYNSDGSILQFQKVQEEVAQSQATQVVGKENSSEKKELMVKETIPWKGWVWIAGIGITLVAVLIYIKYHK